ncbi:hypothetical protein TNCV_1040771 [Trichonephila clavipes]|nr:hypothetical protein TNCV_1040771 [Trichonephila clavipes]
MLDKELWHLGPDGPGVYWCGDEEEGPALDGEKEKALLWIERTEEESPVWERTEREPWRQLEESAKEIGVERKERR